MKSRVCVRSMMLGAAIMLIGLAVGAIVSPPLIAQSNGVFDKIVCRKLTVVDSTGKTMMMAAGSRTGGQVAVFSKDGKACASMIVDENGGVVATTGKDDGKGLASMSADENGGVVVVTAHDSKGFAGIGITPYGNGSMDAYDKKGARIK